MLRDGDDGAVHVALAPHFRAAVSAAAARGRPPAAEGGAPPPDVLAAAAGAGRACASLVDAQWSGMLLFLAGEAPAPHGPLAGPAAAALEAAASPSPVPRLEGGALLAAGGYVGDGPARSATPTGLKLLLSTTGGQLWALLRARCEGVSSAAAGGAGPGLAALVSLLLQLAARGGRGDPIRAVPASAVKAGPAAVAAASRAAADAAALGLAWPFQAAGGEVWLAPTSLAEALRGGGRAGGGRGADGGDAVAAPGAPTTTTAAAADADGFIVVETNFRLYAYTADRARLAALALFASIERRLPNLAVARLTRASVLAALDRGVGAEAVIAFLRDHASPHVAHRAPAVPETVTDQIRLWGAGRARLRATPAVCYEAFADGREFGAAVQAARGAGGLLWVEEGGGGGGGGGRLVAAADAHDAVRAAIKAARG